MKRKAACNMDDEATSPVCCKNVYLVNYYRTCCPRKAMLGLSTLPAEGKATPVTSQALLHSSHRALFNLLTCPCSNYDLKHIFSVLLLMFSDCFNVTH